MYKMFYDPVNNEKNTNTEFEDENVKPEDMIPNLPLAFHIHYMGYGSNPTLRENSRIKVLKYIEQESMSFVYEYICNKFKMPIDKELLTKMRTSNINELKKLNEEIEYAQKNQGDMEVKNAYYKKALFFSRIGNEDLAMDNFRIAIDGTYPLDSRFSAGLHFFRMTMIAQNHEGMEAYANQLKGITATKGGWERINRLKVYEGVRCLCSRDFQSACDLFVDTIPTFASTELMNYSLFIRYTIYLAMMCLPRPLLKKKIIDNQRINPVLAYDPELKSYLYSFYECRYAEFFICLSKVEQHLKDDFFFRPHNRYYVQEMKIIVYSQLLVSYRSLSIPFIAGQFGVTSDYIEKEFSLLISTGRLHCQINLETNRIENNKPNFKSYQFQQILKQGDILLNRIQRLSRVIYF